MKHVLALLAAALLLMPAPAQAVWDLDIRSGEEGLLKGQKREIYALAVSRDGKYLASGSFDGTTRVWSTETWKLVYNLPGHSHGIGSVAFSPDGKYIVSGGLDGVIQVWDLNDGKKFTSIKDSPSSILSVAFSADGTTLASGGMDGQIRVYPTDTWQQLIVLKGHTGGVNALSFSPDNKYLASCSYNELGIRLWERATGKPAQTLMDHSEEVYSVVFSPDSQYLASAGADRVIRIWDTRTLLPVSRLSGHLKPVWSLAFSPDSKILASGSIGDKTIRLWTVPTGANVQTLIKGIDTTYSLVFNPVNSQLYSGQNDNFVHIWNNNPETTPERANVQVAAKLESWRETTPAGDAKPAAGEQGELLLRLENIGSEHLNNVTASVIFKTPGVVLNTPAQAFFISRFEAGSLKKLPLPITLPKDLTDDFEIEILIEVQQPAGQTILPLRVPLNQTVESLKPGANL